MTRRQFESTQWGVVLEASRGSDNALETLCKAYWYPLYAFVRRNGMGPEDAADLTQEFFSRLLEKNWLANVRPERGRFRSFLLSAIKNFQTNEWRKQNRIKRGGGWEFVALDPAVAEERYALEPSDTSSPDVLFERRWAMELVQRTQDRLKQEMENSGQADRFLVLEPTLVGESVSVPNDELAEKFGISETGVRSAVSRLRKRFREILREEVAQTMSDPTEVDAELGHLINVLAA